MIKNKNLTIWFVSTLCCFAIVSCSNNQQVSNQISIDNGTLFSITQGVIPFGKDLRRKWGAAVVADLDKNGWEDVITTQHGTNALIYWNEAGQFTQPTVLIEGDTHGLGVSDYDGDGKMDICPQTLTIVHLL